MGSPAGQRQPGRGPQHVPGFFNSLGGRYKRIRRRVKGRPDPVCYAAKHEQLGELEALSQAAHLPLLYGDESPVCSAGYVPYGWQFPGQNVFIAAEKGFRRNCWGLFSRDSQCHWATTTAPIMAAFVAEQLDHLSRHTRGPTVLVLDNARIHTAAIVQQRRAGWEQRDLYLFFLPPYSPHLKLAETVGHHLKGGWLRPAD